jgi:hypothetical protein
MHRDQTLKLEYAANIPHIASHETRQYVEPGVSSVLRRAHAENTLTGLASRHSRQLAFYSIPCSTSISLRSLRSIPITGLPRYYGRSDPCPAGSSVALKQHEHRLCTGQVSLLHAPELPIPPSPTTSSLSTSLLHVTPQLVESPDSLGSRLHLYPAGSPALVGRIEFVILRMDRSPPAAPHPASRRRSCFRLQAGERMPGGGFHPSVQYYIQHALVGALGAVCQTAPISLPLGKPRVASGSRDPLSISSLVARA